jgi:integrase
MSIYKRKSGRYAVLVDVDRGADGKRKRRPLGTFPTRKEAERAEREALTARDRGVDIAPDRVTVGQLLERYMKDRRALGRGEKTLERYEGIVRHNLAPHIGSVPLAKLRPAHVSELIATLRTRGGFGDRPLSAKSTKHAYALLKGALAWALRQELVGRNVADSVSPPTVGRGEVEALSVEEAQKLFQVADTGRWGPFMRLAIGTGARRGELLALRWSDVDLEKGTLRIRASLSETRAGVVEKSTKTDRVRLVALASTAVEALRRQRVLQAQDRLSIGAAYVDSGHVFQNHVGGTIRPNRASEVFRELAERAGTSTKRLHALRHTSVSWLIAAGVDVRTVAALAGHSSPTVTLSVYSHLVAGAQAKAVTAIDDRLATAKKATS